MEGPLQAETVRFQKDPVLSLLLRKASLMVLSITCCVTGKNRLAFPSLNFPICKTGRMPKCLPHLVALMISGQLTQ